MKPATGRFAVPALVAACLSAAVVLTASAVQSSGPADPGRVPVGSAVAAVPFGPGERAEYQVRLGGVSVGRGTMEILGIVGVEGSPTYHTRLHVQGGLPLARVNTRMDSWVDVAGLFSRRFEQDQHELRFKRHRIFDFYPESRTFRQRMSGEVGSLPTNQPLDDVSFLYYARTLPLRVGDSYTIHRYFKEDGNPVVINVLRRETITVPAGTFNTVVVQPIIKTDGLFGEGGRAEVYFTDDERRLLVQLRSRVPLVGSLNLNLQSYVAGTPLPARR
jgi:hypothetical protein